MEAQAQVAAEVEAKRIADEAAAAEAQRLAAEAEAQRVAAAAAEQARLAAEAARVAAEAAEQARLAAEAEAKRVADEAAATEAARVAAETAAKVAAEAAIKAANTFRVSAVTGTAQVSAAAGSVALTAGSTLTLETAIQVGIKVLKDLGAVVFTRVTGAGIGLLVYSPTLGNSDLYPPTTLTLPAKSLAPDLPATLPEVAATGGTVDVPYRVYGDATKYSVIATQAEGGVLPQVPVRALMLDAALNAYTFITADTPPRTLVFPIATPGNSSTTTPAQPVDVPVYTGLTLTPIEVKAEPLPGFDPTLISDGIYVYPADTGIPPLYAVFSNGYYPAPKNLIAFPDAVRVKSKNSIQGGGALRKRWKDASGKIYEWDNQHGAVELYDKQGKHLGEFNPISGEQTKPASPSRTTPK